MIATDFETYVITALQDIKDSYSFLSHHRTVNPRRHLVIARMIQDLLATIVARTSNSGNVKCVRTGDGIISYADPAALVTHFRDQNNDFHEQLGDRDVQQALMNIVNAASRNSISGVAQVVNANYQVAVMALDEAVYMVGGGDDGNMAISGRTS